MIESTLPIINFIHKNTHLKNVSVRELSAKVLAQKKIWMKRLPF